MLRVVNYEVKILVKTNVKSTWQDVKNGFDEDLFLQLNPPLPKVRLLRFDGCRKGDTVKMELNFLLWKDIWQSDITSDQLSKDGFMFIDEGSTLPMPFMYWRHEHIVEKHGNGAQIIDRITYKSRNQVFDLILFPFLFLQFLYRKPIYKRVFGKG